MISSDAITERIQDTGKLYKYACRHARRKGNQTNIQTSQTGKQIYKSNKIREREKPMNINYLTELHFVSFFRPGYGF